MSVTPTTTAISQAPLQDQIPQPTERTVQNIQNRRPMKASAEKSASAFRTISEVADELKVQQHVLRFWESKFRQIAPLKRGGGRRYYRPADVELLKNIHHLLYQEGYTIKGVQKLLRVNRGSLSERVGDSNLDEAIIEAAPEVSAIEKNKVELKAMLDELKSLRNLVR